MKLKIAILLWSITAVSFVCAEEEKVKPIPPAIKKELDEMKAGHVSRKEILKTAEKLLKNNDEKRASELYKEYAKPSDDEEIIFNQATALLKESKLEESLPLISKILKTSKNEELKDKLRNNVLLTLKQEQNRENQNQKDQNKDDKKEEEKKDSKEDKSGKENKDQKDKGSKEDPKDGKGGKGQDQKKSNGKDEDKKEKKEEKKGEEPKDLEKKQESDEKEGPKTLEEKEKMIEQKRKMIKTPAMIKQIMSDDRELQKRMMDTSTKERGEQKPKRDW